MWLFTAYGFFSISADGTDHVYIRARRRSHLENLVRRFRHIFQNPLISKTPHRDYAFRMRPVKAEWAVCVGAMAAEQNWSNFKDEATKRLDLTDPKYIDALHEIWRIMHKYQGGNVIRKRVARG